MENRRQRREAERAMGFHKIEKGMSLSEKAILKEKKREWVRQSALMRAQEAENVRVNAAAEKWSQEIESLMARGKTREEAEELLRINLHLQTQREADLQERRARQAQPKK